MTSETTVEGGFGLYVHWPFCLAKCPYCDFNSHVASAIDQEQWASAYLGELARSRRETGPRRLETIFFGGGTPSLMAPETIARLVDKACDLWGLDENAEVSLEANPTSVETDRFHAFRCAGINRLSMGVQALNDADLKRLGRQHGADEARAAFKIARGIFPRVSFDLIYARQQQTRADWHKELSEALDMAVDHLSLYQLTIEPGTAFGARAARGRLAGLPDDDLAADMYDDTQDLCAAAGMPAYEISNHARTGAQSRHNLIYWRCGEYVGIGPGAHGRLVRHGRRWASRAIRAPEAWLDAVAGHGSGEACREPIAPAAQAEEYLMMGLRLAEGIEIARYDRLAETPLPIREINEMEELGLIERGAGRLRATRAGRPLLNAIIRELFPG